MSQVKFVPCAQNPGLFHALFLSYALELNGYRSEKDYDPSKTFFDKYLLPRDLFKFFVVSEQGVAGFIILQYVDESCGLMYPKWYVVELYICPEYRRKGIGLAAIRYFCETRSKHFFIYILRKNEPAQKFWKVAETRLCLIRATGKELLEIAEEPETDVICYSGCG